VPPEQLTSANALSQTSMTMAFVLGPALAGATFYLVGAGNEWMAFVLDAASFLVSAFAIWLIRLPKEATKPTSDTSTEGGAVGRVARELVVGIKALAFNRVMATLSVVFAVTMLGVGALNVLWVSFLKSGFGYTDSAELGWRFAVLDVAFFSGMFITSVVVGNLFSNRPPKDFVVWGLIITGASVLPLGYLPNYWLVVALMLIMGAGVAPIETGVMTLMQIVVPNEQLGRVGGGLGTISDTATLTSMAMAGVLGSMLGIPLVFLIAGVMCILGGSVALLSLPHVKLSDKPTKDASARGSGLRAAEAA